MVTRSVILAGIMGIAGLCGSTANSPDGAARTSPTESTQSAEGSDAHSMEGSDTHAGAEKPAKGSGN